MSDNNYLKDAILEYIKNNYVDSVDIVSHFRLRADITLTSLKQLEDDKKVLHKYAGLQTYYEVI